MSSSASRKARVRGTGRGQRLAHAHKLAHMRQQPLDELALGRLSAARVDRVAYGPREAQAVRLVKVHVQPGPPAQEAPPLSAPVVPETEIPIW